MQSYLQNTLDSFQMQINPFWNSQTGNIKKAFMHFRLTD